MALSLENPINVVLVKISQIKIGKRFRKNLQDIDSLANDIKQNGLLHPIVITENYDLIAGLRRMKAFEMLGEAEIPSSIIRINDIVNAELSENRFRENFTISEVNSIHKHIVSTRIGHRPTKQEKGGKLSPLPTGKSRDLTSKYTGYSPKTIDKIEHIVSAAEKNPEKFGSVLDKIDRGEMSISYADQMISQFEAKSTPKPQLPDGEYDLVLSDPPWEFNPGSQGFPKYGLMSTSDIIKQGIPASKDCILFMWTMSAKLEDALEIINACGFEYKSQIIWVKTRNGKPITNGLGRYTKISHEILLIATKGNPSLPIYEDMPNSVVFADVCGSSVKPNVFYEIIEKMYPNTTKLEMFARQRRTGWVSTGDELDRLEKVDQYV
jgi:N6-adenosine-specific RNA methylase IME4